MLSGVSVTWYTWLEQARDITVSPEVLDSIARGLRLSPAERKHLFGLAGHLPPVAGPRQPPSPVLHRLVDALEPHPSYVTNSRGDFLGWNSAHVATLGDPAELAEPVRNIIWLIFTDHALRERIDLWPRVALSLLTQYRAEVAQHPRDDRFDALTTALRQASTEFREWWDNDTTADFHPPSWCLTHPAYGALNLDYIKLATNAEPDVKLVTALPADAETARKLAQLARDNPARAAEIRDRSAGTE